MAPPSDVRITRDNESFTLLLPAGLVTFTFVQTGDNSRRTRITIPKGSTWSPGAHWHEHYVEHVKVIQGKIRLTINGVTTTVGKDDEAATFQKYDVHDFCRADGGKAGGRDEDVVVEEWTDPEDGFKEVFFYNVMSAFADPSLTSQPSTATQLVKPTLALMLQLFTTIAYVDNFIDPFPFLPGWAFSIPLVSQGFFIWRWCLVHGLYGLGSGIGKACGYTEWRKEWTPKDVWAVAKRGPLPKDGSGAVKVD